MIRIGITGAAIALVATACGGGSSTPKAANSPSAKAAATAPTPTPTHSTPSTVTAVPILVIKQGPSYSPNFTVSGKKCAGTGAFADLRSGHAVTIYNQSGHTAVGSGFIKPGLVESGDCYMLAIVHGVPRLPFYEVQFVNRNKVVFSAANLLHEKAVTQVG